MRISDTQYPKLRAILQSCVVRPKDEANAAQAEMLNKLLPLMVDNLTDIDLERLCAAALEEQNDTDNPGSRSQW